MSRLISLAALAVCLLASARAEALQPLWSRHSLSDISNVRSIAAADFNGDGRPDLVTRLIAPYVIRVLLTNADGTLGTPVTIHTGTHLTELAVADADGDGRKDVLFAENDGTLGVLMSNGDGTFGAAVTTATAGAAPRFSAADFNADGKADLAVRSMSASSVAVYAGDGAGHFSPLFSRAMAALPIIGDAGDVDGDGHADYVAGSNDGSALELNFGNGDGTFDAPVPLNGIAAGAVRVVLGDLDADGDRELLIPNFNANTLTVVVNNGSRTFAAPAVYNAMATVPPAGNPNDLFVADVNGDGDADVVMTLSNERLIATYTGNGDGSLNAGAYVYAGSAPWSQTGFPLVLAAADFTGDGRVDLALATTPWVAIWKNVSGDVYLRLYADHPTITAGQTAGFSVYVEDAQAAFTWGHPPPPPVTGTVTLRNGGVDVATAPVSNGTATFEVPSLPLGTHTITAHYSGDAAYREATSASVAQHVITQSSSVTLTSSRAGEAVPYREWFTLYATVTSEVGGSLDGTSVLYIDGVSYISGGTSMPSWQVGHLSPGTHIFYVKYSGSETRPPATSNVVTQVIRKADTVVTLGHGDLMIRHADQDVLRVVVSSIPHGGTPTGIVRLYAGSVLVSSLSPDPNCCTGGLPVDLPVSLPPGVHYLRAVYAGDDNFNAGTSAVMRYIVVPNGGFVLHAWADGANLHAQALYELPQNGHFKIHRRIAGGPWQVFQSLYSMWTEQGVPSNVPYAFRIEAYDASNQLVASTNTEVVMRTAGFTDDRLFAGMPIRAVHVAELVAAANTLRGAVGLGPIGLGDAAAGNVVRASHLQQLRTAINEARAAIGGSPAVFLSGLQPASAVKAAHVQELRDAIR